MFRILSSICVESSDKGWTMRPLAESSSSYAGSSIRKSLLWPLAQGGGQELETWLFQAEPPTKGCCGQNTLC